MTQNNKEGKNSQPVKFCKVSTEHSLWLVMQEPCVLQLYHYAIIADQFGDRFETLHHTLSPNSFKKAKKILEEKGLFEFQPVSGRLPSGKFGITGYRVKNLMGSKSEYWKNLETSDTTHATNQNQNLMPDNYSLIAENQVLTPENQNLTLKRPESIEKSSQNFPSEIYSELDQNNKKINQPSLTKNDQTTSAIDPVIGTNSYKVEQGNQASNLLDAATLDATPLELGEKTEDKVLSKEEAIALLESLPALANGMERIKLAIAENEDSRRVFVIDLLPEERQSLNELKAKIGDQAFEKLKPEIVNDLFNSIVASFVAEIAKKPNLVA